MKTRHVDYPRSAVIVFRLYFKILPISQKASYADSRTLYGLGCPPHTHSHSGGSGALRTTRPTVSSVEKPAIFDTMTGISFQSVLFASFHCLVTDVKMLGNVFYHSDHLIVLDIVVFIITAIPRFETIGLVEIMQLHTLRFSLNKNKLTTD